MARSGFPFRGVSAINRGINACRAFSWPTQLDRRVIYLLYPVRSGCIVRYRTSGIMEALKQRLEDAGQAHVLQGLESLDESGRASFLSQLEFMDLDRLNHIFRKSTENGQEVPHPAEPVDDVVSLSSTVASQREAWKATGLQMISEGKLAVLLLAGGQGTRLGSAAPKGCYDIGLPSGKSLFELHAHRLLRLQQLAGSGKPIRWYIMTSAATDQDTKSFFQNRKYFGLEASQVFFFSQSMLPAFTEDGRVILEAPGKLAMAPDGNGGVYTALLTGGALQDMQSHGIEAVDCYSVDNALARIGDPVFVGLCKESGAQCGARVVAKAYPEEKVGVFARRNGRLEVVEYSELDPEEASAINPNTGVLRYNWSNVCLHYFERSWLESVSERLSQEGKYHVAHKKIPSIDGTIPGIKLELFIFDSFPMADHTVLFEVRRDEEFAPVKNAPGTNTDSPDTAREAILHLHKRWVEDSGGEILGDSGVEVSPLLSYAGEGLEWVNGRSFRSPDDPNLQK